MKRTHTVSTVQYSTVRESSPIVLVSTAPSLHDDPLLARRLPRVETHGVTSKDALPPPIPTLLTIFNLSGRGKVESGFLRRSWFLVEAAARDDDVVEARIVWEQRSQKQGRRNSRQDRARARSSQLLGESEGEGACQESSKRKGGSTSWSREGSRSRRCRWSCKTWTSRTWTSRTRTWTRAGSRNNGPAGDRYRNASKVSTPGNATAAVSTLDHDLCGLGKGFFPLPFCH